MGDERAAATSPTTWGGVEERLEAREPGNLNLLGRFMRALLLGLLKDPGRVRTMERMKLSVAIQPPGHPEEAVTMTFSGGRVTLESGAAPGADIGIASEVVMLIRLARVPAGLAALRFLLTYEGRSLVAAMLRGELRIRGIARHPLGMLRFSSFMGPRWRGGTPQRRGARHPWRWGREQNRTGHG